jgi:hypothetical protein
MEKKTPPHHSMTRRAAAHDYTRPGVYHITLRVADCLGQVLGTVLGSLSAPDGSACISPHEREIITECVNHGFPVIIIADNGFADRYHPSAERLSLCVSDRLLLVSPWQYQYRGKNEQVTVPFCKAMNCVTQALCRTKDSWWSQCP